jgi:hypothetical protein
LLQTENEAIRYFKWRCTGEIHSIFSERCVAFFLPKAFLPNERPIHKRFTDTTSPTQSAIARIRIYTSFDVIPPLRKRRGERERVSSNRIQTVENTPTILHIPWVLLGKNGEKVLIVKPMATRIMLTG